VLFTELLLILSTRNSSVSRPK